MYVHRRTDTKRIFPSLYDMFVGGVSGAKEDPKTTAAREVGEELGLNHPDSLSEPLFDCTVCTSYNRCVVTMFCYTCALDKTEEIQWQEEEVAWGEFVPYNIIEAAASNSIERLIQSGKWPGTFPISEWKTIEDPSLSYKEDEWKKLEFCSGWPVGLGCLAEVAAWRTVFFSVTFTSDIASMMTFCPTSVKSVSRTERSYSPLALSKGLCPCFQSECGRRIVALTYLSLQRLKVQMPSDKSRLLRGFFSVYLLPP